VRWTVAGSLRHIAPELPAALVTPAARERVLAVADRIPAARTRWMYLECRLAPGATQTDLIIRVPREPTSHDAVEALWLEFDCPTDGRSVDALLESPGVFADICPAVYARAPVHERCAATVQVIRSLGSAALSREMTSVIERCVLALPSGAAILYVGNFPHRNPATRRLCIGGITDDALPAYLERIGWPGTWQSVSRVLAPLASLGACPGRSAAIVHIDVSDEVAPTIAVELPFSRASQRVGHVAELGVMDALVAAGLCDRAKRDALLAWPRRVIATMPHELWPSAVTRRINHVKLVWRPDEDVEAKVYLAASHRALASARTHVSIE
jgi:hypothetical protein